MSAAPGPGGLAHGTRVVVSGSPTTEEVAAVVAALDRVADAPAPPRRPAWQEAARREGVGFGAVRSRWDLVRPSG